MFYLLRSDPVQYISGSCSWVEVGDVFVVVSAAGCKSTTKCNNVYVQCRAVAFAAIDLYMQQINVTIKLSNNPFEIYSTRLKKFEHYRKK
jgi:hypothetical protein